MWKGEEDLLVPGVLPRADCEVLGAVSAGKKGSLPHGGLMVLFTFCLFICCVEFRAF